MKKKALLDLLYSDYYTILGSNLCPTFALGLPLPCPLSVFATLYI